MLKNAAVLIVLLVGLMLPHDRTQAGQGGGGPTKTPLPPTPTTARLQQITDRRSTSGYLSVDTAEAVFQFMPASKGDLVLKLAYSSSPVGLGIAFTFIDGHVEQGFSNEHGIWKMQKEGLKLENPFMAFYLPNVEPGKSIKIEITGHNGNALNIFRGSFTLTPYLLPPVMLGDGDSVVRNSLKAMDRR